MPPKYPWEWNVMSMSFVGDVLSFLATLFVVLLGFAVLAIFAMFLRDRAQTEDAVRRNYPVIGRFRKLFTELGEFFRPKLVLRFL